MDWTPADWTRLGVTLRARREQLGLSRRDLATATTVTMKKIQLAEEGWHPTRWPKHLDAIATGLGWAPGSMQAVLSGGAPVAAPAPAETARAELAAALQRVRETLDFLTTAPDGGTAAVAVLLVQQATVAAQRAAILDATAGRQPS